MLELAANAATTLSIWLAVRNNIHTWTTGIVGCILFLIFFYQGQLYADSTLQVFFVITSLIGIYQWTHSKNANKRPITKTSWKSLVLISVLALSITAGYGYLLQHYTNDFMPFADASVLTLSVIAQLLLMQRKFESWPFWIGTNTLSVYLYLSRGMNLTAILYAAYWCNAWYGWYRWKNLMRAQ